MKKKHQLKALIACLTFILPMVAAANDKHPSTVDTLEIILSPKNGYSCHTPKMWLNTRHASHPRIKPFTLQNGASKTLYFEIRRGFLSSYNTLNVNMTFVCQPINGDGPKKTLHIHSRLKVTNQDDPYVAQSCASQRSHYPLPAPVYCPQVYSSDIDAHVTPSNNATITSKSVVQNARGWAVGRSTIKWTLG